MRSPCSKMPRMVSGKSGMVLRMLVMLIGSSQCIASIHQPPTTSHGERSSPRTVYNREMTTRCLRALAIAALCVLGAALVCAQDWNTLESLPAVDLSSLSPAQKATALKLLRARDCTCGCGMKVAECRVKDPNCYYSKGLASIIVASLKAGKNEKEALADAAAPWTMFSSSD